MPDTLINTLKIDFGGIAVSLFVVAVGLIAVATSLFRLKGKDFSLLNFGLFSLLYGLRWLMEIPTMKAMVGFPFTFPYFHGLLTYLVAIPFCALLVNIFGRGLYNSMLWVFYSTIAYAIIATAHDLLSPGPLSDVPINRGVVVLWGLIGSVNLIFIRRKRDVELIVLKVVFLVVLFSFMVDNIAVLKNYYLFVNLEHPSFILLMIGLGYVAIHHTFANDKKLQVIEREIEIARKIQQFNLPANVNSQESMDIAARYVPMSTVAGDFYDIHKVNESKVGVLIADVSGHGIGAALIGSMLKIAFASQAQDVADPAKVLTEINRILQGKLESSFVTACAVFIDMENKKLCYARAGHPPPILWRSSEQELHRLTNGSVMLGPFPDATYENTELDIRINDRLVLYTDGIIETSMKSGELFGIERLESLIKENSSNPAERSADLFIERLAQWSGKSRSISLDDDLTLIIIDMVLKET
jgi:sigma-B regulation protein RsbU (phosphoserine phosphatase)